MPSGWVGGGHAQMASRDMREKPSTRRESFSRVWPPSLSSLGITSMKATYRKVPVGRAGQRVGWGGGEGARV